MAEVEINCSGGRQAIGSTTGASNLVPLYFGFHPWAAGNLMVQTMCAASMIV
jgi:hypothetical protein